MQFSLIGCFIFKMVVGVTIRVNGTVFVSCQCTNRVNIR